MLGTEWTNHPGYMHGLTQCSISGLVLAPVNASASPQRLRELLQYLTGMELPESGLFDRLSSTPLLKQLIALYRWIQLEYKIPVFSEALAVPVSIRQRPEWSGHHIFLPCYQQQLGMNVLAWCVDVLNHTMQPPLIPVDDPKLAALKFFAGRLGSFGLGGINNFHFLAAAHALGIQVTQVSTDTFVYGLGRFKRTIQSAISDQTPFLAVMCSQSKEVTSVLLGAAGIPVPANQVVPSVAHAVEAATRIGFPVVIKPDNLDQGRGVFSGLLDKESVETAFLEASKHSKKILVEKHVPGHDYRVVVVNNEIVKVILRRAGSVSGDGRSSITELVNHCQSRPDHARIFRLTGTHLIQLDDEALGLLKEHGMRPESVLAPGVSVPLRRKNNISTGGTQILVEAKSVHPDNANLILRAVRCLGLDLAGVDFLCTDISRSWLDIGAHIIEVNSKPQISVTDTPEIYAEVLSKFFPRASTVRVCLLIVPGQKPIPSEAVLHSLAEKKKCGAFVSEQGAWIGRNKLFGSQSNSYLAARMLMLDSCIDSVLCVMRPDDISRYGIPFRHLSEISLHAPGNDGGGMEEFVAVQKSLRTYLTQSDKSPA